jgi:hypothetical protein
MTSGAGAGNIGGGAARRPMVASSLASSVTGPASTALAALIDPGATSMTQPAMSSAPRMTLSPLVQARSW